MAAVEATAPAIGTAPACVVLGLPRATLYRRRHPAVTSPAPRPTPPRALDPIERQRVLETLHSERFLDAAPAQVHATLLDEGTYLCAPRTMYRLLDTAGEIKERRDQVRRSHYAAPELLATRPNEVWSWDISVPQQAAKEMREEQDWPLALGLQEQGANHRKRLGPKAPVVSVAEKVPRGIR